jgi:hypothetical protein
MQYCSSSSDFSCWARQTKSPICSFISLFDVWNTARANQWYFSSFSDLFVFIVGELFALRHNFSPLVTAVRTQMMLVINWHFLTVGINQTFTVLTKNFPATSWLEALTYSSQFFSNKFA